MVTIKEIARECNVSPTTVSNILNGRPNVGEETKKEFWKLSERGDISLIILPEVSGYRKHE